MSVGDRVEIYLQYSTVQYLAGTVCLLPRAAPRVIPTTGVRTDRTYCTVRSERRRARFSLHVLRSGVTESFEAGCAKGWL